MRLRGGGDSSDEGATEQLLTHVLGARDMTSQEVWSIHSFLSASGEVAEDTCFPVVISIPSPEGAAPETDIAIVGSWSNWLSLQRMHRTPEGDWKATVLLPTGAQSHTFKILSQGRWFLTPAYPSVADELGSPGVFLCHQSRRYYCAAVKRKLCSPHISFSVQEIICL